MLEIIWASAQEKQAVLEAELAKRIAGEFVIEKTPLGKPFVRGGPCFNISHTGTLCALAFSEYEIGIDIERIRERPSILEIAKKFHSEEYNYIVTSNQKCEAFFYVWTRKEALLKALGTGISGGLNTYNVLKDEVEADNSTWYLKSCTLQDNDKCDYAFAICQRFRRPVLPADCTSPILRKT